MSSAVRPSSPIRIDWASMQSSSRESSDDLPIHDQERPCTPPPKQSMPSSNACGDEEAYETTKSEDVHRVYDITTLMKYRGSLAGLSVFAKIRPEALAENLFQYVGNQRPLRSTAPTRAWSEMSNRSIRPEATSGVAGLPHAATAGFPRQDQNKPENLSHNLNDGFVRFLKQHASPPHHRVTAGGRIVPAGPHSPPPMFDYESLTGMMERRRQNKQRYLPMAENAGFGESARGQVWPGPQNAPLNGQMRAPAEIVSPMLDYQHVDNQLPVSGFQSTIQAFGVQPPNPQMTLVPVSAFGDGSLLASCNGLYFRTYWNGMSTVIEPLHLAPGLSAAGFGAGMQPAFAADAVSRKASQPAQIPKQAIPLANATNRPRSSESRESRSHQLLDAQERRLKTSLQGLDRHMALHHYQLSHEQKDSCISQRRSLVEDIDSIRRARESSSADTPIADFKDFAKGASLRNSKLGAVRKLSGEDRMKAIPLVQISHNISRKALSPNAPPFVPHGKNPGSRQPSQKYSIVAAADKGVVANSESSKLPFSEIDLQSSHRHEPSLDRDHADPAMRVIHNSDVSYAAKYEDQKINGKKQYCTKVSEFQEALRRVREQARLYGCAGGSSKDPAYDAEQDIWWAICDKDPIPLPSNKPDHIEHPRAWDWNKSVFNFRAGAFVPQNDTAKSIVQEERTEPTVSQRAAVQAKDIPTPPRDASDAVNTVTSKNESRNVSRESNKMEPYDPGAQQNVREVFVSSTGTRAAPKDVHLRKGTMQASAKPKPHQVSQVRSRNKSISESDAQKINMHEARKPFSATSGNRQTPMPASNCADLLDPVGKKPAQIVVKETQPKSMAEPLPGVEVPIRGSKVSTDRSFVSAEESIVHVPNTRPRNQKSNGNLSVRSKGPKRVKSRQQLQNQTPLHRHRKALKHLRSPKQDSRAKDDGSVPDRQSSESSGKPHQDGLSDKSHRSLFSIASQQLSPRSAAKKAMQFYDRSRSKSPLKRKPSGSQLATLRPRVNLPDMPSSHLQNKPNSYAIMTNETRSVAVTSPIKNVPKDSFLRDMLRSARFLSGSSGNKKPSPQKMKQPEKLLSSSEPDKSSPAKLVVAKENAPARKSVPESTESTLETDFADTKESHVHVPAKAVSSLAASSFNANAFLPQYDGAGKAQTAKLRTQHGFDVPSRQARVSLPTSSSYSDIVQPVSRQGIISESHATPSASKRGSLASSSFGLDGSSDEPGSSNQVASASTKTSENKREKFDTRGLTESDFNQKRANPHTEEHDEEVDRFFEQLEAREKERMERRLRENTKTT